MKILLDTHAFVWLVSDPAKLNPDTLKEWKANPPHVHVSVITAWEIALLVKRGRLILPSTPPAFYERALAHHGLDEIPIERRDVWRAVALPDRHNDPFDRLLIAQALGRDLSIMSRDARIRDYPGVRVVW